MNKLLEVYVDGIKVDGVTRFILDHIDRDPWVGNDKSHVKATIEAGDIKMTFTIEGKEQIGNTVYFYGPLRRMFPIMFVNDPLPWQVSYLEYMGKASLTRFKVTRDDPMFTTEAAKAYLAGFNAGEVYERKLAKIASDGLKNGIR